MTAAITLEQERRQPSQALTIAIKNCALGFRKLQDSINECLDIGRAEGYRDIEIGRMIKEEMVKNSFSIRTVQRYLPASAKGKVRGMGIVEGGISDNLSQTQLRQEAATTTTEL